MTRRGHPPQQREQHDELRHRRQRERHAAERHEVDVVGLQAVEQALPVHSSWQARGVPFPSAWHECNTGQGTSIAETVRPLRRRKAAVRIAYVTETFPPEL
ncbi:MAG: hypothetical protein ACJ8G7_13670, partial [Rhizobacter sp.]